MNEDDLSKIVFAAGLKVHKALGNGLLERAYEECLRYELNKNGLFVETQKILPLAYEEIYLDAGFRIDIMVERKLILEIKTVEKLAPIHFSQLLTYLKLSNCKLGLLMNFNTALFKDGIRRVVNNLYY
jgi:GxxExxY protein